ncbi:DEDD exonuclease domain-containing protein [Intrasporangium calvum]|uniref:DEDD exonuclease domain-containing protein n=1 Tax=Intrasporangium calvum TaxID=53358 RepID=A0ABT5GEP1_9MICO|nr:DEDD exonuclease domain-containing protein [Intrasporangium calvum]MDC5696719.1 DEDD exonuclease domain-containing protein [Intrasporangium calvum]
MQAIQATFDDLGTRLADVTFVVVDLESTGGSPAQCGITEIGAVKVRAGVVLGEFQTLVNPAEPIPAFISVLTGITDAMVAEAPRIESAFPAFLEFAAGSVLVAHNAGFDISFLKAAAVRTGTPWPDFDVLDTLTLARHLVTRDEAPNHKLSSLARVFASGTTPDHRALHDARATVDVLHGLIERVGSLGVHTLEELASYTSRVSPAQRRKRFLADSLPHAPGVYLFKDADSRVLYVGTSRDIRSRVRTYFTASEQRSRMADMVRLAHAVTPVVCQTPLEAQVRELRLIDEHKPRFNRRSKNARRHLWVKLTNERFPRLSIVRQVREDRAHYIGPFRSRMQAQAAIDAVHEIVPLRQCTQRITGKETACALAELGRCGSPCTGSQSHDDYAHVVADCAALFAGDARSGGDRLRARLDELAAQERFEDAARIRDRFLHLVRGAARSQRLAPVTRAREVVAARRGDAGGWEIVCIRHGRLAGTVVSPRGADPMVHVRLLQVTAEVVPPPAPGSAAALVEETELLLRWLEAPGVRIVELDGSWTCPVGGAGALRHELEPAVAAAHEVVGFDRDAGLEASRGRGRDRHRRAG